ncbi:MAG: hypothetical protein PHS44_03930 [Candidatus Dojkabacteria bacterium]|nr:hypothetical protein [Candidatus Dojkabacteria bacterium]
MPHKPSSLILYSKNSLKNFIPNTNTVYYLRGIADENSLYPIYYIGQAKKGRTRDQLVKEFFQNNWNDVVYINYVECDNEREAKSLAKQEIARHKPKYNSAYTTYQIVK